MVCVHSSAGGHQECLHFGLLGVKLLCTRVCVSVSASTALACSWDPSMSSGEGQIGKWLTSPDSAAPPDAPDNHQGALKSDGCLPGPHARDSDGISLGGAWGQIYFKGSPSTASLHLSFSLSHSHLRVYLIIPGCGCSHIHCAVTSALASPWASR